MQKPCTPIRICYLSYVSCNENESSKSSDSSSTSSSSSDTVFVQSYLRNISVLHNLKEVFKKTMYEPTDMNKIIESTNYLDCEWKESLFKILQKHKLLFQGRYKL